MRIKNAITSFILICTGLLFAGCGFQPLYKSKNTETFDDCNDLSPNNVQKKQSPSSSVLSPVKLEVKGSKDYSHATYIFKQQLQALLLSTQDTNEKISKIQIKLHYDFKDIGYKSDISVIRKQGKATANILIYDHNGKVIYNNDVEAVTSFNLDEAEEFSNISAASSAERRIVNQLSYLVLNEIRSFKLKGAYLP